MHLEEKSIEIRSMLRANRLSTMLRHKTLSLIRVLKKTTDLPQPIEAHPIGFVDVKIHEYSDRGSLHLHIWDSNKKQRSNLIHTHTFDFISYVFWGWIEHTEYASVESLKPTHSVFNATYQDEKDERFFEKTSYRCVVDKISTRKVENNERYRLPKNHYHRVSAVSPRCVTLFLKEPMTSTGLPSKVLIRLDGSKQYCRKSAYYSKNQLDTFLTQTLACIEKGK